MRCHLQLAGMIIALGLGGTNGAAGAPPSSLAELTHRAEVRGYRVREVRWDPVLRQRWAVLESIGHPERPLVAELTDAAAGLTASDESVSNEVPPVAVSRLAVRSGDKVTLWKAETNVRMQMGAIADGNGAVGERIVLRATGAGINGDTGWRITGIVRGPGSVEMEQ